jgi:nitrogen regulatory protein P-II 1
MKKLEVIIPHERLVEINTILHKRGASGMTFYDVKGRWRMKEESVSVGRGATRYVPEFGSWTKIEVLLPDSKVKPIVDDIMNVMKAGSACDGKIVICNVIAVYDTATPSQSRTS